MKTKKKSGKILGNWGTSWNKQECIPVGCVVPTAVAVQGGLHQAPPGSRHPPGPGSPPGSRHPPTTRHPPEQAPPPPQDQAPFSECVRDHCQNKIHNCYRGNAYEQINGTKNFLGNRRKY